MEPLLALVISTAISMAVVPVMWRLAPRLGMLDEPDTRKVHHIAIPRVGGWGIVTGALVPIVMLLRFEPLIQAYVAGSLVLLLFGTWDDARQINHRVKFLGQFIAVGLVVFYGGLWIEHAPFMGVEVLPAPYGMALTFFAMVGMINAVNTSDGLDGLAGGESLLSLLVIVFLAYIVDGDAAVIVATAAIGGALGFLRYNTHPARVFMGDTGSQFLGFTLGFLAIVLTQRVHTALSPAATLLFLGLPIIDIFAVMIDRIRKGISPFKAAKNHVHHRLMNLGFDHYETVVMIYTMQAALVIGAVILRYESDVLIISLYLLVCTLAFGTLALTERSGWRMHKGGERSSLAVLVESLRQRQTLARTPMRIVCVAVPIYVLAAGLLIDEVPRDFAVISAVLFAVTVAELMFGSIALTFALRAASYVAAIFTVYLVNQNTWPSWHIVDAAYFALLALAIALTVRFASDHNFRTTPMDYLLIFGLITIAVLGDRFLPAKEIASLIIKAMILLYGCEVIIERTPRRWNLLNASTAVIFATLAVKGLA